MIGRQVRIIATMLLGAMLIAAGILFFFPAHAGATQWRNAKEQSYPERQSLLPREE
jgi:hypothetical protein